MFKIIAVIKVIYAVNKHVFIYMVMVVSFLKIFAWFVPEIVSKKKLLWLKSWWESRKYMTQNESIKFYLHNLYICVYYTYAFH